MAGILDDPLVMVVSEMGRTSVINELGGTDHWPFTSALLIGAGVRPGVYSATDATLRKRAIDLDTGAASESGRALQIKDLLAALAAIPGVDAAELRPEGEVLRAVVAGATQSLDGRVGGTRGRL